jgi:hypothetical protein
MKTEDVIRVLAGEPTLAQQRARTWARIDTQGQARLHAAFMGLTKAAAVRGLKLRKERAERRAANGDPLTKRNAAVVRWVRGALRRSYDAAGFRRATHGHHVVLVLGDVPGATVETAKVSPSKAGLPRSYDYRVTQSYHALMFARDWLTAVKIRGAALVGGKLVLALATEPDSRGAYDATWVRQGAGTALVVEQGQLIRRKGEWAVARARKSRAA